MSYELGAIAAFFLASGCTPALKVDDVRAGGPCEAKAGGACVRVQCRVSGTNDILGTATVRVALYDGDTLVATAEDQEAFVSRSQAVTMMADFEVLGPVLEPKGRCAAFWQS